MAKRAAHSLGIQVVAADAAALAAAADDISVLSTVLVGLLLVLISSLQLWVLRFQVLSYSRDGVAKMSLQQQ